MKAIIVNDTSLGKHFGPKLVMSNLVTGLMERDVEILGRIGVRERWMDHRPLLDQADLVIVNGEGSIHHDNRPDLMAVAAEYPSALINCVYQENTITHGLNDFKYVSARESLSALEMPRACAVVPDLIFAVDVPRSEVTNDVFITDSVLDRTTGMYPVTHPAYVRYMGSYQRALTGRFHAACLSMMWGQQFSAWPSNTHKIEGMLQDADCPNIYPTLAVAMWSYTPYDATKYVVEARKRINTMLDTLVAL